MLETYLFPEDFDRCPFSFGSFSSMSSSSGMAAFSISRIRSRVNLLTGGLPSSKLRTDVAFIFESLKSYLFFFCASTESFILRTASWWVIGLECLRSSRITSFGSLFWSNGLAGNSLTDCFIAHKDAKKLPVLPIKSRSSIHRFDLRRRLAPARSVASHQQFARLLGEYASYYCNHTEWNRMSATDIQEFLSSGTFDCDEHSGFQKVKFDRDRQLGLAAICLFQNPFLSVYRNS